MLQIKFGFILYRESGANTITIFILEYIIMSTEGNTAEASTTSRSWKRWGVLTAEVLTPPATFTLVALFGQALAFSAFGAALTTIQVIAVAAVIAGLVALVIFGADKWYYREPAAAKAPSAVVETPVAKLVRIAKAVGVEVDVKSTDTLEGVIKAVLNEAGAKSNATKAVEELVTLLPKLDVKDPKAATEDLDKFATTHKIS
jgi:hypothetical protein